MMGSWIIGSLATSSIRNPGGREKVARASAGESTGAPPVLFCTSGGHGLAGGGAWAPMAATAVASRENARARICEDGINGLWIRASRAGVSTAS